MTTTRASDPAASAIANFLATCGEPDAVREEIEQYWRQADALPYPIPVFNHLVDRRIASGAVSAERGQFLKDYFAESFSPEPVTGYLPKHREPLVRGLAEWYVRHRPERRFYRIGADIMNLSGLNRDVMGEKPTKNYSVLNAGPDKVHVADAVIRLMSSTLHDKLCPLGDCCEIRYGGDELSIYLLPKSGVTMETVNVAIANAQKEIAQFVCDANLRNVVHPKKDDLRHPRAPGIGLGGAVVDVRQRSLLIQNQELEANIIRSKAHQQSLLGPVANEAPVIDVTKVARCIDKKYYEPIGHLPLLAGDKDFSQATPEGAQMARITRRLQRESAGELTPTERQLLDGVAKLVGKTDFVTGLPLFGSMRHEQVPHFIAHHGTPGKLVHFDFSNMGGANKFGSWVGDATSKIFVDCLNEGLIEAKMQAYQPYLAAQGGGKFALLLPESVDKDAIYKLHDAVDRQIEKHMKQPLLLTGEEFKQSKATPAYQQVHKDFIEHYIAQQLKQKPLPSDEQRDLWLIEAEKQMPNFLTMSDITSDKTPHHGSQVVCKFATIDLSKPVLGKEMKKLEHLAQQGQNAIAGFENRREHQPEARQAKSWVRAIAGTNGHAGHTRLIAVTEQPLPSVEQRQIMGAPHEVVEAPELRR